MKKMRLRPSAVLAANLLLCAVFCQGQDTTRTLKTFTDASATSSFGTINWGDSSVTIAWDLTWGSTFNYSLDTVKAVLLITDCDNCQSKSVTAFAIRGKSTYYGDRMPPGNYYDYWSYDYWPVKSYLDDKKKPFPSATTIWDCRLK